VNLHRIPHPEIREVGPQLFEFNHLKRIHCLAPPVLKIRSSEASSLLSKPA
jgi:hypothetical protein